MTVRVGMHSLVASRPTSQPTSGQRCCPPVATTSWRGLSWLHEGEDVGGGAAFVWHLCDDLGPAVVSLAERHRRRPRQRRVHEDVANHLPYLIDLRPHLRADFPRIKDELAGT